MTNQPVLIVGAGPTGLMMACELARFGIPFRLIDKKTEPAHTSNAAGVQTRTLEIFQHVGMIDTFLEKGIKCLQLRIHDEKDMLATVPLDIIDSPYRFILLIPQSKTEPILTAHLKKLGGQIERGTELLDLQQKENYVVAHLKKADGSVETVNYHWVIGCDGYHSTVREKANIAMVGEDIEQMFVVADVIINTQLPTSGIDVFLCKGVLLALFPLNDPAHYPVEHPEKYTSGYCYRIAANLGLDKKDKTLTKEELAAIIKNRSNGLCELSEVIGFSPFWIHSKVAVELAKGSIFIAGDAAHVHSPAGGQGMNTGLQDAYNLAWKLAAVINGKLNHQTLYSYHEERYPIIKSIVSLTEKVSHSGLSPNKWSTWLRNFIIKHVVGKSHYLQDKIASRATQLSLSYEKSSIIEYQFQASKLLKPGKRIIDATFDNGTQLYGLISNNFHNLIVFTYDAKVTEQVAAIQEWIKSAYPSLINVITITKQQLDDDSLEDKDLKVHQRYDIKQPSLCLIRPDHYIAFSKEGLDTSDLARYLENLFIK